MNTNQTNVLVAKCYDNTYQVCTAIGAYVRANAPDQKSRDKARVVVSSNSDMPRADDMLYRFGCVFNQLSERSYYKAEGLDVPNKHTNRADFYRDISQWARACYVMGKEAPVIKDAEDDSDPYVKPAPKADQLEQARAALIERLTLADFGKRRIDTATALFKSVVLERPIGATVLDVLERFGDEASELSWESDYSAAAFWDACVQISDDLRSELAADQINKASTLTVPEPETAGVLWEVTGDPDRALYRTRMDAERAAWNCFPDENSSQRYERLRSRTIKP